MTLVLVEITRTLPNFRLFGLINLSKELLVGVSLLSIFLKPTSAYFLVGCNYLGIGDNPSLHFDVGRI